MAGVMALAIVGLVALLLVRGLAPKRGSAPPQAWFHDLVTGELFAAGADEVPPIPSPAGNEAVRAHFFSCGTCSEGDRFLGFYSKYTPEARQMLLEALPSDAYAHARPEIRAGHMISRDAQQWVVERGPEGGALHRQIHERCGERLARSCDPS